MNNTYATKSNVGCIISTAFDPLKHKPVYKVGVLAIRGFETAYKEFNETFSDYLTMTAGKRFDPPIRFEMVPLNFVTLFTHSESRKVDYIYVNPSAFSCIESEYGAESLVSQISRRKVGGNVYNLIKFGGIIACKADNDQINTVADLRGKIIAAASISGLGSGQMQFKKMIDAGLSYINDPKQLVFTSNQGKVVNGILNGDFDVGFIRTDQIERTKNDKTGILVNTSQFKIIGPMPNLVLDGKPFPFESSTELYPEWNVAALTHVPGDVSIQLQSAMLALDSHADLGQRLKDCQEIQHNVSYCRTLHFPTSFTDTARCDTSEQIATIANSAKAAGKYAGWRTTLSYMQLRSMQESTGFISFDEEKNTWRCARVAEIYDAISCPVGTFRKNKADFDNSCSEAGLVCKDDYKCVCNPCYAPFACEGTNIHIFNNTCLSFGVLFATVIVPTLIIVAIASHYYVRYKRSQSDCVWLVKSDELDFGQPSPQIIGKGTFGLVLLAEYRGTKVAVKRVIPPKKESLTKPSVLLFPRKEPPTNYQTTIDHFSTQNFSAVQSSGVTDDFDSTAMIETDNARDNGNSVYDDIECESNSNKNSGINNTAGEIKTFGKNNEVAKKVTTHSSTISPTRSLGTGSIVVMEKFLKSKGIIALDSSRIKKKKNPNFQLDEHSKLKADFIKEMRHLSKLRHPCITTVMGAVINKQDEPMLVMEYMNHGSLYDVLHNKSMVIEGEFVLPILRDVANGLRFLHMAKPQVIHGDLKAQNVLVDSKFRAKVADFGLSQKRRVGVSGTPYWMAPELLRGESRNTCSSDIYSFGIMLYEIYARKEPYEGEDHDEVLHQVCSLKINKRPSIPSSCPPMIAGLMRLCLLADPFLRPTAEDIDMQLKFIDVNNVEPNMINATEQEHKKQTTAEKTAAVITSQGKRELLYDVFPKHIADSLVMGRKVEAEYHDMVTVYFSDVVGFTDIAASVCPAKVSDMLHRLYLGFDSLTLKHKVFKIETAGDSYMIVSNLVQNQNADHVKRVANFAIDANAFALKTLIDLEDPARGSVQIRGGFHSGPVVSNVVGSLNPKYGIFGDTVNISSRMESHSTAGRIQCSRRSALLLRKQSPTTNVELRGEIIIKGKGEMTTYWVVLENEKQSK